MLCQQHADVTWRKLRPWQSVNSFEPASDRCAPRWRALHPSPFEPQHANATRPGWLCSSKTHSVTTKVGLGRLLASGGQWVGIDHEQFFPQQFDISDPGEAAAFIRQYQYGAAQVCSQLTVVCGPLLDHHPSSEQSTVCGISPSIVPPAG